MSFIVLNLSTVFLSISSVDMHFGRFRIDGRKTHEERDQKTSFSRESKSSENNNNINKIGEIFKEY